MRGLILAEMLARMGFRAESARVRAGLDGALPPSAGHRIPSALIASAPAAVPAVVDEIAFQTRSALAHRALADVIPFARPDERAIRQGARSLARGRIPEASAARASW